jgi:predicted ribosomally synthesized peptide with SipW-like signal peptide
MKDDDFELSRRKALAALGTIGVASAGAGLGTSAYFSDQETFENNQLTAGTLDMHIGWEEHYSDWSPDEDDGLDGDVTMGNDQPVGLPTQNSSLISVNDTDDALQFLNNTETDQYPNGTITINGSTPTFDDAAETNGCSVLPDGADQSPVIVDLDDVKPGDFGEVTFSFALCDNPGYVWMNGGLVEARENGHTEPEADDPDEEGASDEVSTDVDTSQVELLDAVQTALWYDDGDNLQEGSSTSGGAADVVIVADGSGSVTTDSAKFQALQDGAEALVNAVGSNVNVGFVPFSNNASVESPLTATKSDTITEIQDDGNYPGGGTDIGAGIDEGQAHLTGPDGRPGVNKVLVVLTNGSSSSGEAEATAAKNAGTTIYGIAYGTNANENLIEDISSPPKVDDGSITADDEFAFIGDQTDISSVFTGIGGQISTGEEVFFQGSLREALAALEPDTAADRNQGVALEGDIPATDGGGAAGSRDCFSGGGTVHSVGFAWWLPVDHANEVQSDEVTFDLGFYTEQCRHNDGAGMNNAEVGVNETDDDMTA